MNETNQRVSYNCVISDVKFIKKMNPTLINTSIVVLLIWVVALTVLLVRMMLRYQRLTAGIKKKELRELLENANTKLMEQKKATQELEKWIERLEQDAINHIQKVGFVRFNPFSDTGGNQSFCLALLDLNDDGIVISSLHSREQTRIYAKRIKNGKTDGPELSKEEKETIQTAVQVK